MQGLYYLCYICLLLFLVNRASVVLKWYYSISKYYLCGDYIFWCVHKVSKNNYHRTCFTAVIKFTTNMLINSIQQTIIKYLLFTSPRVRPVNRKALPARRSQSDKIKEGVPKSQTKCYWLYRYLENVAPKMLFVCVCF